MLKVTVAVLALVLAGTASAAWRDLWARGERAAEAEQREYTAADYYAQVDGLGYDAIVTFTDPTGETAKIRYRIAMRRYAPPSGAIQRNLGSTALYPRPDGPGHRG